MKVVSNSVLHLRFEFSFDTGVLTPCFSRPHDPDVCAAARHAAARSGPNPGRRQPIRLDGGTMYGIAEVLWELITVRKELT